MRKLYGAIRRITFIRQIFYSRRETERRRDGEIFGTRPCRRTHFGGGPADKRQRLHLPHFPVELCALVRISCCTEHSTLCLSSSTAMPVRWRHCFLPSFCIWSSGLLVSSIHLASISAEPHDCTVRARPYKRKIEGIQSMRTNTHYTDSIRGRGRGTEADAARAQAKRNDAKHNLLITNIQAYDLRALLRAPKEQCTHGSLTLQTLFEYFRFSGISMFHSSFALIFFEAEFSFLLVFSSFYSRSFVIFIIIANASANANANANAVHLRFNSSVRNT